MKRLYRRLVEETDSQGVVTEVSTLITADCIHDVFEQCFNYKDHVDMELISISRVGHVAHDISTEE